MTRDDLPDLSGATTFDERLREIPLDAAVFAHAIAIAEAQLIWARTTDDQPNILRLLGYLGDACRVVRRLDEAVAYLEEALDLARSLGDERREVANMIRLGEARKCRGEHDVAEALLRDAVSQSQHDDLRAYEDFALQHLGKFLLEQDSVAEAIDCLERARALRLAKGQPGLVESTERALDLARRRLSHRVTSSG